MERPQEPVAAMSLRDRHRAATQVALQEAAIRLFAAKGYRDTSVEEIAAEAGVSRSTFFRYFGSKEALIMQRSDRMGARFSELLHRRPPDEGALKALEEALVALAREASTDGRNLKQLRAEAAVFEEDPVLTAKEAEARTHWIGVVARVLAERAGRPEPTIEESLASAILVEISRHVTRAFLDSDGPPEDEIRRHFSVARRLTG